MSHFCGRCFQDSNHHDNRCYESETDCPEGQHWPPLCCRGCECHSYEDAHPMLHVLQAMSDHDIGFQWHGDQLRIHWWEGGQSKRRLTREERRNVLQAVKDDLAWRSYPAGRHGRFGVFLLTVKGQKLLHGEAVTTS